MEKVVTWTKGIFDSSYQIFCNGQICGNLIFETWNNHAFGIMSQKNYHFRCKGFSSIVSTIYGDNQEELGHITFHMWQFRAVINLKGQAPLSWNYSNSWLSSWNLTNYQDTQLNFKASSGTGMIIGNNLDNELALLAGLYVKEFFSRILVTFIVFVAIMVALRGV
ncbi:MAG: hypothetical protein REI64_13295 [Pedobacter sp.]|uniref:hypothetical protein n=1 Tax=Pedobacter sp. TaxID=1411316 RepID=UPI002806EECC|nr:hypothetical protein [Pedobacter sp.]MDQ8005774.1 hypothetical protein [Pedobacter sp.]